MDIKKQIKKIIKEYISNDEIYLKDYLSMSDEAKMEYLPHEYYYFFDDFLIETDYEFEKPKESNDDEHNMFDNDLELMTWLEYNDKETYNMFARYLFDKIKNYTLPINDWEYPAWSYFSNDPEIIKNQWLIHFTNNADKIAREGFKYGVNDITKLALTTHMGEYDKKYGGYNFAYLLSDFPKYSMGSHGYHYGNEAVIFNASGIRVWHYGDEEYQVIFYGNTAKNIIPINKDYEYFTIYNKKGSVLFSDNKLENVVTWLVNNYNQYRRQI